MCQITSLITFKVNIIQPTQQNQLVIFYTKLCHFFCHRCSPKVIPEIEIVFFQIQKKLLDNTISNHQNQCFVVNWLKIFVNHYHKTLNTIGYHTLSKICELFLLSNFFILLIFIFFSISKSVIVVPIIFINSLRITFWIKLSYPVFDWYL